ncbi:amino acid adenylation domain-containing protein [Virgibacillus sp. NKC19-3]|uniref:non-ribosomal peptide synthetase n=1 Tax=Virgibacillus saliphilus TaxID=2831674 RepID=UPI001C9A5854|nr:non-ribosomal peptide synthetase [Virgibacillus sp. NKC19-3]MBY7142462.1 amino acid adenylation domain-containing protein [Virgibacillus sp. NKC19-3]
MSFEIQNQLEPYTSSDKEFWIESLHSEIHPCSIIEDHNENGSRIPKYDKVSFSLDQKLSKRISDLSVKNDLSLFLVLLANTKILFNKYNLLKEIAIGVPSYKSSNSVIEGNIYPIISQINDEDTFKDLLIQIRENVLKAYKRQNVLMDEVLDHLGDKRANFFNVTVSLKSIHKSYEINQYSSDFVICFNKISQEEIKCDFKYNKRLYNYNTIKRLIDHLKKILDQSLNNINIAISDFKLITNSEKELIIRNNNKNQKKLIDEKTTYEIFNDIAKKNPSKTVVVHNNLRITYGELNKKVDLITSNLLNLNVKKGEFIGVFLERGIDFLASILAILKVNCIFVPLDPANPDERIRYMIDDSDITKIISNTSNYEQQRSLFPLNVILTDSLATNFLGNLNKLDVNYSIHNPMYIIYTSGTTGKPKGVIIRHDGALNHIYAEVDKLDLRKSFNFAQTAPLSSDISIWQFIGPVLFGGKTVIVDKEKLLNPKEFISIIREEKVSIVELVPSVLKIINDYIKDYPSEKELGFNLEWMMVTGETVRVDLINDWLSYFPDIKVVNAYGPAEASDDIAQYIITSSLKKGTLRIPIGKPIHNISIYILDQNLEIVPYGVPGEICVSGVGVGNGYINNQKSKESFIPNHIDSNGSVLYRTGDLGRLMDDGNIEYLGRIDNQVKINGHRIELEEIEILLSEHSLIKNSVVSIKRMGDKNILVAYYVIEEKKQSDSQDKLSLFREFLSEKLPSYLIPSKFIEIENIPTSNNGKINRLALPDPYEESVSFQPETNTVMYNLLKIWKSLLQQDIINLNDNFYELGGDSIIAIQIVARAKKEGIIISPQQIMYSHPTIFELSKIAKLEQENNQKTTIKRQVYSPITPIQSWFFKQDFNNRNDFNHHIFLELRCDLSKEILMQSIENLMNMHESLKYKFRIEGKEWIQYIDQNPEVPLAFFDISKLKIDKQDAFIESKINEINNEIDIEKGPIFSVVYFYRGSNSFGSLVFIVHHLVVDGISWRIILDDFHSIIDNSIRNYKEVYKNYSISYIEWANSLKEYADSIEVKEHLDFWKEDGNEYSDLFSIENLKDNSKANWSSYLLKIDEYVTELLLNVLSNKLNTNANELLICILANSLSMVTNKLNLTIDIEGHGRDTQKNENIFNSVGWFTSLFPLSLSLPNEDFSVDYFHKVNGKVKKTISKGMTFGLLKYLNKDVDVQKIINDETRSQVRFNYMGQFDSNVDNYIWFLPFKVNTSNVYSNWNSNPYLIDINSSILNNTLMINFNYTKPIRKDFIVKLAKRLKENIKILEKEVQNLNKSKNITNFPGINIKQEQLSNILKLKSNQKVEEIYYLSPMQKSVLFHNIFSAKDGANSQQISWDFIGPVDIESFKRSWQYVINRHSILRTSFYWRGLKDPLQVVSESLSLSFRDFDWSHYTDEEQKDLYHDLIIKEKNEGFNPTHLPLVRFYLIKTSSTSLKFVWSYWSSLFDNWSWTIILKEVFEKYKALEGLNEYETRTAPRFSQYIEFINKQEDKTSDYWKKELADYKGMVPSLSKLKINKKVPLNIQSLGFDLSKDLSNQLYRKCREYKVTISSFFQAVWSMFLYRKTDENDLLYGVLSSGRPSNLEGIENMVGLFVNILPVRLRITNDSSVFEIANQIQEKHINGKGYEHASMQLISKWAEIPMNLLQRIIRERSIVFITNPSIENMDSVSNMNLPYKDFKNNFQIDVPLRVFVSLGEFISFNVKYDKFLYDESTIEEIISYFKSYLECTLSL